MCFGYIARLSHWGGVGYFTRSNDFYLPSLRLEEGLGEWDQQPLSPYSLLTMVVTFTALDKTKKFLPTPLEVSNIVGSSHHYVKYRHTTMYWYVIKNI